MTTLPFDIANIELICKVDEQWSFVSNKKNCRWLWYAWELRYKRVIAYAFGKRSSAALQVLLDALTVSMCVSFCL
ncbi:IS1 family transposase [Enterovibrio nigricans]|uniref:IS1 family transposase n=1 Tax=Enterovibrio nigricans TaxID=504469 RepID=UPI00099B11CE|nr:hypothetical protein AT251_24255 [Enterovibrio nigricans]